jgi:DNA-binding MarR family transcriptional regulator
MSMKTDPVAQWRDVAALYASVHAALDRELREQHDLSPVEYEVLEQLCTCQETRMQEVASAVHLNQSTCSRVVARLEEEGLATRAMCSSDRRGIYAKITEEGRKRREAAAPTYRRVLAEALPR